MPRAGLRVVDSRTVVADDDGTEFDVLEAAKALPWVDQLCPLMPHQYAVQMRSPEMAFRVLEAMVAKSPESYRAYFRGYQSPNRYWDAPDGLRYWRTRELNRCDPDSVEPLRRVEDGAKPIKDWDGPPWTPNGIGIYLQAPNGKWWPTQEALASGFQPCRACSRRPRGL
jgi:hypothetical protein